MQRKAQTTRVIAGIKLRVVPRKLNHIKQSNLIAVLQRQRLGARHGVPGRQLERERALTCGYVTYNISVCLISKSERTIEPITID